MELNDLIFLAAASILASQGKACRNVHLRVGRWIYYLKLDWQLFPSIRPFFAKRFSLTPGSAKNRMRLIRDFLGADTNTQAVAMAVRRKVIQ